MRASDARVPLPSLAQDVDIETKGGDTVLGLKKFVMQEKKIPVEKQLGAARLLASADSS